MSSVDELFEQYAAGVRAGGPADPQPWLDRLEGADRAELAALISAFVERAPRRRWDPEAFEASGAREVANAIGAAIVAGPDTWPELLPRLRTEARIKRSELVSKLASALGFGGQEQRVAAYYNRMEHGLLPEAGVHDRVLEALAAIVGTTADRLREAGRAAGGPGDRDAGGAVFARRATGEPAALDEVAVSQAPPEEPDELDRMFLGDLG